MKPAKDFRTILPNNSEPTFFHIEIGENVTLIVVSVEPDYFQISGGFINSCSKGSGTGQVTVPIHGDDYVSIHQQGYIEEPFQRLEITDCISDFVGYPA